MVTQQFLCRFIFLLIKNLRLLSSLYHDAVTSKPGQACVAKYIKNISSYVPPSLLFIGKLWITMDKPYGYQIRNNRTIKQNKTTTTNQQTTTKFLLYADENVCTVLLFQADLRFCIGSVLMNKATISVKGLSWFHLTVKARSQ